MTETHTIENVKEVYKRNVKEFGGGAHVILPKKTIGKNVTVIVTEEGG